MTTHCHPPTPGRPTHVEQDGLDANPLHGAIASTDNRARLGLDPTRRDNSTGAIPPSTQQRCSYSSPSPSSFSSFSFFFFFRISFAECHRHDDAPHGCRDIRSVRAGRLQGHSGHIYAEQDVPAHIFPRVCREPRGAEAVLGAVVPGLDEPAQGGPQCRAQGCREAGGDGVGWEGHYAEYVIYPSPHTHTHIHKHTFIHMPSPFSY